MSLRSSSLIVMTIYSIFLYLFFCLCILFSYKKECVKISHTIVEMYISPFGSVSYCYTCFETMLFGLYIYI